MTTLEGEGTLSAAAEDAPGVLEQLGHPRGRRQKAAVARMLAFGLRLGRSDPAVAGTLEELRQRLSASVEPVAGVLARRLVARGRVAWWILGGTGAVVTAAVIGVGATGIPSVLTTFGPVAVVLLVIGWFVLRRVIAGAKYERARVARWLANIAIVAAAGEILARRARESRDRPSAGE